jgi:hypothetical protein
MLVVLLCHVAVPNSQPCATAMSSLVRLKETRKVCKLCKNVTRAKRISSKLPDSTRGIDSRCATSIKSHPSKFHRSSVDFYLSVAGTFVSDIPSLRRDGLAVLVETTQFLVDTKHMCCLTLR